MRIWLLFWLLVFNPTLQLALKSGVDVRCVVLPRLCLVHDAKRPTDVLSAPTRRSGVGTPRSPRRR